MGSVLVLAVAAVGCSGVSDGAAPTTSTTAVDFDVTTTLPPDEQAVVDECEAKIRATAPDLAASAFPDNPEVQWSVVDLVSEVGLSFAEVEPAPADGLRAGYRLVVECNADSEPVLLGIYERDGETWALLSTTDELGGADIPDTLG